MYVDEKGFCRWDNDLYVKLTDGRKLPYKCPNCDAYMNIENKVGFTANCENGHFYGVIDNPIRNTYSAMYEDVMTAEFIERMRDTALKHIKEDIYEEH